MFNYSFSNNNSVIHKVYRLLKVGLPERIKTLLFIIIPILGKEIHHFFSGNEYSTFNRT